MAVVFIGPPALMYAILSRLARETRSAFYLAWLDARGEVRNWREWWHAED